MAVEAAAGVVTTPVIVVGTEPPEDELHGGRNPLLTKLAIQKSYHLVFEVPVNLMVAKGGCLLSFFRLILCLELFFGGAVCVVESVGSSNSFSACVCRGERA